MSGFAPPAEWIERQKSANNPQRRLTCSITVGPMSIFFTNVNKAMNIPGHSHFAEVIICFATTSDIGFPSFEQTHDVIHQVLTEQTKQVFRGYTNEDVAHYLFDVVDQIKHPDIDKWGGSYHLGWIELAVRGVPDKIGHADGFTRYRVGLAEEV